MSPGRAQQVPPAAGSASGDVDLWGPATRERPGPDAGVKERQAYWVDAPLLPPVPPPGLERKRPQSDTQRRNKRFQKPFSIIGVPQLGGNPDFGVIVGLVTAATWYGDDLKHKYYDYAPFKRQIIAQAQVALKRKPNVLGRQNYLLRYRAPYLLDSLFSLTVEANYLEDANSQYFGTTAADTMRPLSELGPDTVTFQNGAFGTYNAYQEALRDVVGGRTFAVYNNFRYREPRVLATAKVDLLGGILIPAASLKLGHVFIDRYGGDRVRGTDDTGISEPTKLDEDCAEGIALRCDGDWDNTLKLSLTVDVRDFPVDPDNGALLDFSFEGGPKFLGSPGYWRSTNSASVFWSPLDTLFGLENQYAQLVLAARFIYSVQGGNGPFYARNRLSFNDRTVDGLGGVGTLRGYRLNRFVGDVMAVTNLELRYDFLFLRTERSTINFKLVPFFDAGRAWDAVSQTSLKGYRWNAGAGLYLQWNQSNIIRADVGAGDEGVSFGVNFGLLF